MEALGSERMLFLTLRSAFKSCEGVTIHYLKNELSGRSLSLVEEVPKGATVFVCFRSNESRTVEETDWVIIKRKDFT